MHFFRTSAALALLMLLIGCGGSDQTAPASPQTGTSNPSAQGQRWDYIAFGDSLAFGVGGSSGYVPRYATHLRADTAATVTLQNLGIPGLRSGELLAAIRGSADLRRAISEAEVITFNIGGNDLLEANRRFVRGDCGGSDNLECFRTTFQQLRSNWDAIIAELLALRGSQSVAIRTMNLYNPFVSAQKATGTFDALRAQLESVNAYLEESARRNNIPIADIYHAFNGAAGDQDAFDRGLLANDRLHPNDEGYRIMAEALRALGYSPLR